ncbi:hypothetical protein PSP3_gp19c [Pseudomonas phage PSP3-DeSoir-2023]|nr:hypothetical protein PSP3_gp19c [Pseudomonas phage PSP3-DeSoir-2023]
MKPRRQEVRVSLETALWMSTSAALLAAIIAGAVFPPSTIQCPEERQPAAERFHHPENSKFFPHTQKG